MKYISYNKFIRNTVITSTIIIAILFAIYSIFIQSHSIEKSVKTDTSIMSNLVFQNLYTVMKKGGTKEELDEAIERSKENMPNVNIKIINSFDTKDEYIKKAFETKESEVFNNISHIDFIYPVLYKNECLQCHTNAKVDDVAAVMNIEYPLTNLKVSVKEISLMIAILFLISIVVIFVIWFIYLRKYFVTPIENLISQMKLINSHKDLKEKIKIDTIIKEIKQLETVFNTQNTRLFDTYHELESLSNTDNLTKINNRKKFEEYSSVIIKSAKRYDFPFSIMLIDLNKFKPINDTYGHDIGDEILIHFSKIVSEIIRESDVFFRIGGDEFVLILPHTKVEDSISIIKKIKDSFKNNKFIKDDITIEISASYGVAEYPKDADELEKLLKVADTKMYEDKNKNR